MSTQNEPSLSKIAEVAVDEPHERSKYHQPAFEAPPLQEWLRAPTLVGPLGSLRPLTVTDADGVLSAYDVPSAFAYSGPGDLTDRAAAQKYIEGLLSRADSVDFLQLDCDDKPMGVTTFYDIDATRRQLAIGYTWFSRRVWGTGTNAQSKLLLLSHAFETLGAVKVIWHVDIINLRSRAAVLKLGASFESLARKDRQRPDGSWRDTATYSMLDEEWPTAKAELVRRLVQSSPQA